MSSVSLITYVSKWYKREEAGEVVRAELDVTVCDTADAFGAIVFVELVRVDLAQVVEAGWFRTRCERRPLARSLEAGSLGTAWGRRAL